MACGPCIRCRFDSVAGNLNSADLWLLYNQGFRVLGRYSQNPQREFVMQLELRHGTCGVVGQLFEATRGGDRVPLDGVGELLTLSEAETAVLNITGKVGKKNAASAGWKVRRDGNRINVREALKDCGMSRRLAKLDKSGLPPCPQPPLAPSAPLPAPLLELLPVAEAKADEPPELKRPELKRQVSFNRAIHVALLLRQEAKCNRCKNAIGLFKVVDPRSGGEVPVARYEIDHIESVGLCKAKMEPPRGLRNVNNAENLQILCPNCHTEKSKADGIELGAYRVLKRSREQDGGGGGGGDDAVEPPKQQVMH